MDYLIIVIRNRIESRVWAGNVETAFRIAGMLDGWGVSSVIVMNVKNGVDQIIFQRGK